MRRLLLCLGIIFGGLLVHPTVVRVQPFAAQIVIAINQLTTGITPFTQLQLAASSYINWGSTSGTSGYGFRDNAGAIQVKSSGGSWATVNPTGSGDLDAGYWVRTSSTQLTNETIMGSLGTGLVLNATTTGVPTIFAGTSCTNQFPRSLSTVGAATCASVALTTDVTGTLPVANGGTGLTTGTSGGVLSFTAAGTIASSAALTANRIVLGGGAGVAPGVLGSLGTTTTVLHGNAAGAPTFGAVDLTTEITGILPTANGGTGIAYFTAAGPTTARIYTFPDAAATILTSNAAVTAAQGGTGQTSYTVGDLLYASATTTLSKLADIATGNALISGGIGVAPAWGKIGLTTHVTGTLPAANGGTGIASYTTGDLLYASSATSFATRAAVAVGQVLVSNGTGAAPVYSADPQITTLKLDTLLLLSSAEPTISSGFGTSPSVTGRAAAFRINVGSGGTATGGVIGLPTAVTGWNCNIVNLTALAANRADQRTTQVSSSTTTATVQNQTISTGAALAWTANDILAGVCLAY